MTLTDRPAPDPRSRQAIFVLLLALLTVGLVLRHVLYPAAGPDDQQPPPGDEQHVQEFAIFNTYGRMTVYAAADVVAPAFEEILTEMGALHNVINRFDPDSELAKLNRLAFQEPFACSDVLWDVLLESRRAYRLSRGAFDVSVGPLMALWGFHRKRDTLPADNEVEQALRKVGLDKVTFDDREKTVRFARPGMSLDLGGIAKGYALDRVVTILREHGLQRGLVDLGGNICCLAYPPPGRSVYTIGIRNPFDTASLIGRVRLLNRAVATSGNYERYVEIEGRTIAHIIDPRSGQPVSDVHSVTVITPNGTDSDILSTALFVAGEDLLGEIETLVPGAAAIRVTLDDDGRATADTWGSVRLLPP